MSSLIGEADPLARAVIEAVTPEVDCGRFPIKRVSGETVRVEADVFCDGHDLVAAVVLHRAEGQRNWREVPMTPLVNDRFAAEFTVGDPGTHLYTVEAWVDHFATWQRGLAKKVAAGLDVAVDLELGAELVKAAAARARKHGATLTTMAAALVGEDPVEDRVELALDAELTEAMAAHPDRSHATRYRRELQVEVDRERARFSSWYELFPRSTGPDRRHGTFRDLEERLQYVADLGFDVVYLPPIHPIGRTQRKGPNNTLTAGPDDPGVPWAIGSEEGGHTAVHPQLGTLEDFRRVVERAAELGMEIALDVAFQCSPDHPWVKEHPEWFRWRPDGTVQYAENPPKKYEDIYPINFETSDPEGLWQALKGGFEHWMDQGVRIFRVDNPHTKAFPFWEWLIGELRRRDPGVILLSEAFTRPKVMYRLAKLGFTQSYTYFAWRNTRWELESYLTEVTTPPVADFFRPNLWPNTPDILTEYLQVGGRPAFMARLVLAATLGASYGIYGPAFELCVNTPRSPGSEEYLNSEKYEIKDWDWDDPTSLAPLIRRVNQVRREHPSLQTNQGLVFHPTDNEQLICYSKRQGTDATLVVVNLDPHHVHSGWVSLDLDALGLDPDQPYQVHDRLTERRFIWQGSRNFVELDPAGVPAHLFTVRRRVRTERDFDYFM